ncbi:polysaccharide deacetylase family protein [Proteiniborus sp. DW1]|uniref:polysaccharide deacetylase family protein n=1 Tax=Proteiniborus sp. DW1 TaxID=1889883 RepID=UPI00092E099C|nr:polysaccharide deacetylase family protein [Proteiniborus sp. DW1]SCG84499.1 polysaccharide deacetylase family protein [Proteiniborus sp. DW1]
MKKIVALILIITVILNLSLINKTLSIEMSMLNDDIGDVLNNEDNDDVGNNDSENNSTDYNTGIVSETDSNDSDNVENIHDPNNGDGDEIEPKDSSNLEGSQPNENLDGTDEPTTELPSSPTAPTEDEPVEADTSPVKPEVVAPPKPTQRFINTLNKENAWSNKTVYLTFDDGPSSLTTQVLDLLKKENIKATFFVIGTKTDEGKNILKRISDEGHSIGNHTFSHNYNFIYKSVDNFFDDLYKNENIIYESTGKRPKIIRFPGGSNNATTKTETGKKVINDILDRLAEEGYVHFDWNASSGDASAIPASVDDIVNNTLTWISRHNTAIVLFHDTASKTNTLKALPTIIEKLKFLGCKFEVLTTSSPHIAFVKSNNSIEAVPASTDPDPYNIDILPNNGLHNDRKPSHVIKKLMKLEMEVEKRFLESRY